MTTTWVLFAGLPAAGKSTLAQALENRLNRALGCDGPPQAVTLNKDRIRSLLFPGALTDNTPEQDDLCMRIILEAAAYLTAQGRAGFILVDGRTFSRRRQIDAVLDAAEKAGARWRILHLTCTDEIAAARLDAAGPLRTSEHPARNRDLALYRRIKREFEPIVHPKLDIDSTQAIDANVDAVLDYLRA